jgi:predicted TIM-barrel fold metal-dependent hydrolase
MKIDIFNHFFPKAFFAKMVEIMPNAADMHKRVRNIPCILDLDERFRIMDMFPEYVQVLSMVMPTTDFGPPPISTNMARLVNEGMAELVQKYPDRFVGFVACLPLNDPEAMMEEATRAIKDLRAAGVLVFTNVMGGPLTTPEIMPLFDLMAEVDLPIWMHPTRGADFPDYKGERKSHYEIWWTFGWPYETSVTMAHLVFSGLFDRLPNIKIITHHMGGMIPYFEGRVGPGWDQLGTRTSDEDYFVLLKKLKRRPLDYFRLFYADTALFGAQEATVCGLKFFGPDRTLFGTDMPLDPEKGPAYVRWTIKILDSLDISPAERYAIYEGNARKLLKLK